MVERRSLRICLAAIVSFCLLLGTQLSGEETSILKRSWKDYLATISPGPLEPASIGSYSIRVYGKSFDSFIDGRVGVRDGTIVDAWMLDLDGNMFPEIAVWTRSAGSGSYGKVHLFTLENAKLRRLDIVEPDSIVSTGYQGHDRFAISQNRLQRSFPIYKDSDLASRPSGGTRHLLYSFSRHAWENAEDTPGPTP